MAVRPLQNAKYLYQNTRLLIKINEAKNLNLGICDTYCVVKIDNQTIARTATAYKTDEPFWGEEYTFHIPTEFQKAAVYVYKEDQLMGSRKESIGKVMLDRDQICADRRGLDRWVPLTRISKADEIQGEVLIEIRLKHFEEDNEYKVIVNLVEGRDLAAKDTTGYSDPCAKLVCKDKKSTTKIIHKSRFPKWFHEWSFVIKGEITSRDVLTVIVSDLGKFSSSNDFMGQVNISLSELEIDNDYRTWCRLQHKDGPEENGHKKDDLGSLRIKAQIHEQCILPCHCYEPFVELMVKAVREPRLAPTGSEVLIMLEDIMTLDRNTLAHTMVRFYISVGAIIPYLDCLTVREILSTNHPATLFRSNSLASKSYDQFMKVIALPYLHEILKPFVDQIYQDKRTVELDPSQLDRSKGRRPSITEMGPGQNRLVEQSQEIVMSYCLTILDSICNSIEQCPRILRVAFRQLWQRVEERFWGAEYKDTPFIAISSFIFLRFFVPAILSPKLFSLRELHPDQRTERTLKLVSKVLQSIGNLTPEVDAKEAFMKPLTPFITASLEKAKTYILDLIQIDQRLVREEKKLAAGEYLQTLILLRGFLMKRSTHGSTLGNPYRRRYFCLSSVLFQYGKEPNDPHMRSFPVKWISVVEKLDGGAYHKKNMFQVTISAPESEPEVLYLEAADVNEQNIWVSALRKACLCNREMDTVFHPGVYRSKTWTCCRSPYKAEPGCSPAHRSVTLGDWRDPLDPDVDAQTIFSQFNQCVDQLKSKYLEGKSSLTASSSTRPYGTIGPLRTKSVSELSKENEFKRTSSDGADKLIKDEVFQMGRAVSSIRMLELVGRENEDVAFKESCCEILQVIDKLTLSRSQLEENLMS